MKTVGVYAVLVTIQADVVEEGVEEVSLKKLSFLEFPCAVHRALEMDEVEARMTKNAQTLVSCPRKLSFG